MKRKLICLIMIGALCLSFSGCNSENNNDKEKSFSVTENKLTKANVNAKIVHGYATGWLIDALINDLEVQNELKGKMVFCNKKGIYTDENGNKLDFDEDLDKHVDYDFTGCFAFEIDKDGDSITSAYWSEDKIIEIAEITDPDEQMQYCKKNKQIIGIYPFSSYEDILID